MSAECAERPRVERPPAQCDVRHSLVRQGDWEGGKQEAISIHVMAYPGEQLGSPCHAHRLASLTVKAWPARSVPWSPAMAALAVLRSGMSTNPKPYGWPVPQSVTTSIVSTAPYSSKSWRRS